MNLNLLTGDLEHGIQGIDTSSKKQWKHNANKLNPVVAASRIAFLGLIKLNVFGLSTAIWYGTQKDSNLARKWSNGWWNFGGSWTNFISVNRRSKNRKAIGIKIAPKFIKDAYSSATGKSISGSYLLETPLGVEPATITLITAASGAIIALTGLIRAAFQAAGKDMGLAPTDVVLDLPPDNGDDDDNGGSFKLGFDIKYLILGVGAVFVLSNLDQIKKFFSGTKKKSQKLLK